MRQVLGRFEAFCGQLQRQNSAVVVEIGDRLARLDRKLEYAFAGFPIQRFRPPDPPTDEVQLLRAKYRAVDLVGRDDDLDSLWQWLSSSPTIAARLLVGKAGAGKSRLAYELLLRVNERQPEWQAGLVGHAVLRTFDATKQPADWTWPSPTLLVVDYAQAVAAPLGNLLRALTYNVMLRALPLSASSSSNAKQATGSSLCCARKTARVRAPFVRSSFLRRRCSSLR